jgi:hypothetical protein
MRIDTLCLYSVPCRMLNSEHQKSVKLERKSKGDFKQMSNKQANTILDANTLAQILAQSLTNTLAALGVVQVTAHPSSVPSQAQVTKATVPNITGADKRTQQQSTNGAAVKRTQSQAHVQADVPNYGDFHCKVGANRSKLPMGLFDDPNTGADFEGITLRLPNGVEHWVKTDGEGRGRLTLNQTDSFGAHESQGHILVFTRDEEYANVYDVSIWAGKGHAVARPSVAETYSAPRVTRPQAAQSVPSTQATSAPMKKARSAAQLANDEKLRNRNKPQAQATVTVPTDAQGNVPPAIRQYLRDTGLQLTERVTDGSEEFDNAFDNVREIPHRGFDVVKPGGRIVAPRYQVPVRK